MSTCYNGLMVNNNNMNQVELMSLLIFVMPGMFAKRKDQLKKMFSLFPKNQDDTER